MHSMWTILILELQFIPNTIGYVHTNTLDNLVIGAARITNADVVVIMVVKQYNVFVVKIICNTSSRSV